MFYCEFHIYVWECFTVSYTEKYENIATKKKATEEEWFTEMHCI